VRAVVRNLKQPSVELGAAERASLLAHLEEVAEGLSLDDPEDRRALVEIVSDWLKFSMPVREESVDVDV
jgi:hypothetical protein